MTRMTTVTHRKSWLATLLLAAMLLVAQAALAQTSSCCRLPDNGNGTVDMAPLCPDGYAWDFTLQGNLPVGTTIEFTGALVVQSTVEAPGGFMGGTEATFDGIVDVSVEGTGLLDGFTRSIDIPVTGVMVTSPRNPGDAVQDFDTELLSLQGQLFGDPDFCTLVIEAGSDFGLPSPGHTTLTRVGPPGGDFTVDSFFDIVYRIDFQGCPGSILEGMGGITQDEDHIFTCEDPVPVETTGTWGDIKSMYAD